MNRRALLDWILARLGMQLVPSIDLLALYPARVTGQSGQTVDVECDDVRVGTLSRVPLQLGLPGAEVTVSAGARVLVGWHGGDARKPYSTTWESGATVTTITIRGTTVHLGSDTGSNFVALANLVDAELAKIQTAHNSHVHVITGTVPIVGAVGSTNIAATAAAPAVTYTPASTAAAQVKAK